MAISLLDAGEKYDHGFYYYRNLFFNSFRDFISAGSQLLRTDWNYLCLCLKLFTVFDNDGIGNKKSAVLKCCFEKESML